MKTIPRCIHQIWMQGKDSIPSKYKDAQKSWKSLHSTYTIQIWDEKDLEQLVRGTHWTNLIKMCNSLIQRADIYRCAVLEYKGGIYIDMDMYALKSLEPLLLELDTAEQDIAVGQTSFTNSPLHSLLSINNAWISARKHSMFWQKEYYPLVLSTLHQYTLLDMISPVYNVLKTAGPGAWTRLHKNQKTKYIKVLPQEYFYSLKKVKHSVLTQEDIDLLKPLSYAYHRQDSTWMKSWESLIIALFLGNAWKITVPILLLVLFVLSKTLIIGI